MVIRSNFSFIELTEAETCEDLTLAEKTKRAIDLLIEHEPEEGYWLAFSGGKDSIVLKALALLSGVKFEAWYSNTTIDPPELVRFIKKEHKDVKWNNPKMAMMKRVVEKSTPPTRIARWCCEEYKERGGRDQLKLIGVRAFESTRRALQWKEIVPNFKSEKGKIICPIVYWKDAEVWEFIRQRGLPYCELYDQGFKRLGCIGCPLAGSRQQKVEFERWPRYGANWKRALIKHWEKWHDNPRLDGKPRYQSNFKSGEEFYEWWISGTRKFPENCQMELMWTN